MTAPPLPPAPPDPAAIRRAARLSVAPMIDWTDRHCRYFHRLLSREALLYTEMVAAPALIHGPRERLLGHHPAEAPLALQLGGADPEALAAAVRIAAPWGFGEINLNLGCPSDRVQSGCFGAVLMKSPGRVAECLAAMTEAAGGAQGPEITVKCRIGVDDQNPREVLPAFLETVAAAGVRRVIIHARKAWLAGLSPRENREIPPLDHSLVLAMKRAFPALHLSVNGGVTSLADAAGFLAAGLDGVMIGRAAYHEPLAILGGADRAIFGQDRPPAEPLAVAGAMRGYILGHLAAGGRLNQVTRHMLGLFHGRPGARLWRRILSVEGGGSAGIAAYDRAVAAAAGAGEGAGIGMGAQAVD